MTPSDSFKKPAEQKNEKTKYLNDNNRKNDGNDEKYLIFRR